MPSFNYFGNFSTNLAHFSPDFTIYYYYINEKKKSKKKIFVYISGYNSLHTTTTPLDYTLFGLIFLGNFELK